MEYENYCIGNKECPYKLFFVTGASRSGKTTFSKILGSMKNAEWIEEPYELSLLLWTIQLEKEKHDFAKWRGEVFNAICKELINNVILLRNGNFRPGDLSTIWNYKDGKEIFQRLVNVNTRDEVQEYIKDNNCHFIIDIPEALHSSEFMRRTWKDLKILHVVRNPYDVADAVCSKHWNSDEKLCFPSNNGIFRKHKCKVDGKLYYIPWWVEEKHEEEFISATEYERGIIYWISMVESTVKLDLLIRYEDLVRSPLEQLNKFNEIGFQSTARTIELCKELQTCYIYGNKRKLYLSQYYMDKFNKLKEMYGYE